MRDEWETDTIDVFSDSDWAGCVRPRRSTSGGVVTVGGSAIKHWSLTQATVALSSGEAEHLALVKAACEGIGIQALARDLGWEMCLIIHVDSSTARSIANRTGVGKLRHIETRVLLVQQAVRGMQVRSVQGGRQGQPRRHSHEADVVGRNAEGSSEVLGPLFMLKESLNGGGGLITPCREPASEGSVL